MAKFTQNPRLQEALMSTTGLLVEASPRDRIWGIGLHEKDARKMEPEKWPGCNLLGNILTQVREDILSQSRRKDVEEEERLDHGQLRQEIRAFVMGAQEKIAAAAINLIE
eukprot:scaffold2501_cov174-Amphora_coffeaeformis.AAC.17